MWLFFHAPYTCNFFNNAFQKVLFESINLNVSIDKAVNKDTMQYKVLIRQGHLKVKYFYQKVFS